VDIAAGLRAGSDLANHGGQPLDATPAYMVVVGGPGILGHVSRGWTDPGRKPGVIGSVEVIRQRYDGDLGVGHDAGGVLALLRLPVEVRHGPGVACSQPTVELGSVRVRLESGYSHSIEAQLEGSRSEEHTSELQSRFDLVCRLLLEKKKMNTNTLHFIASPL